MGAVSYTHLSLLIRERTALMNEMRGLLAEYGVVVAQGAVALRRALATIVEDHEARVSDLLREILSEMSERLRLFEERLKRYDLRITEVKDGNILLSVHTAVSYTHLAVSARVALSFISSALGRLFQTRTEVFRWTIASTASTIAAVTAMARMAMMIATAPVNPSDSIRRVRHCSTTRRASSTCRPTRFSRCWRRRPNRALSISVPAPECTRSNWRAGVPTSR